MDAKREEFTGGVDRLSSMLDWWGVQGNQTVGERIKRFQELSSELQNAYSEAYSEELDALSTANDRLSKSLQGLLRSRKSDEFFTAQMDILAGLMESASRQVTTWSALGWKIQRCCTTVAREAVEEMRHHAEEPIAATEGEAREEQQRARRAARS